MLFKKMLAVLSAIAVIGTCSVYNSSSFTASAENEIVSDAESETCSIVVSMSSLSDPIPEDAHIKARLVRVGEEEVDIDEWEISQDGVKELKGLEYSEEFSYKIIIDDLPENYSLPESTTVMLNKKGDTDNIIFSGRGKERADHEEYGMYDCIGVEVPIFFYGDNIVFISRFFEGGIQEKYIIDENGARYCGIGGIELPDGHYTAYVTLRSDYRFVQPFSEAAASIIDFHGEHDRRINMDYFDRDFSKGFEFDVVNGETDTLLDFYVEPIPNKENACSADISVVDSETGEAIDGIKFQLTNERLFKEGYINWNSSDSNPKEFDKLVCLNKPYVVSPISTSEFYYIPTETFSFSSLGQHKNIVIKAKRKNNTNVSKIVLPDESPVPIDDMHCAVTVGVMDNDSKPAEGVTATIYKKVGNQKTTILIWNAEEEPVKTLNDIEYDEDAKYYVAISGESDDYYRYSDMQLAFSKGGSVDKVVQVIFPTSMKSVNLQFSSHNAWSGGVTSKSNSGLSGIKVTDMQGYRYPCTMNCISLPDGDYVLKPYLSSNYRIVQPNTEMECVLVYSDPSLKGYFEKNTEYYNKGVKFTVKDGECNDVLKFYAEDVPNYRNSCSADIRVVDEKTEENVEGVTVVMNSSYNPGNIRWNTTDSPVMHFDYLRFLNEDYSFELIGIPEGYTYKSEEAKFSFEKYGEH
ncbi:MAG: hypothetical protein IKW96_09475 [Ruminococcus sp.]|uniref:hypothetical protein n=1 Tax=Ruminococcus sp. TaxID=41978 RepID=UPI0025DCF1D7|nr:hypothetical protein [Ruminococcus sp.]MBR5683481.1 hypothetical protein [Ruminococcus sp.]